MQRFIDDKEKNDNDMLFHECPSCNILCNCSNQPCSCCGVTTNQMIEDIVYFGVSITHFDDKGKATRLHPLTEFPEGAPKEIVYKTPDHFKTMIEEVTNEFIKKSNEK